MKKAEGKGSGYRLLVGLVLGLGAMGWAEPRYAGRNQPNESALKSESNHSALASTAPPGSSEKPTLGISLRLYNYAHVPGGALAHAKSEAQRILTAAGVDSLWFDCSLVPPQFQSEANQDCAGPFGGRTLVVRILPGSTPAKAAFPDTAMFGFAEGGTVASVFYGRITDFAVGVDKDDSEIPVILGAAIAHELGHLLLGSNSHSATGIMCGQWDRDYLRLALMERQLFTPQQAEVIRTEVGRRNHIEVTGDHEPQR
jgi:hypothetical protein